MSTRYTVTAYDTCPACEGRRGHAFHRQGQEYWRDCGTCKATGEVSREAPFAEALAAQGGAQLGVCGKPCSEDWCGYPVCQPGYVPAGAAKAEVSS